MKIWKDALDHLGLPYIWAGNSIKTGLDCSGLVCHLLRKNFYIGKKDYSAKMLFDKFRGEFIEPREDALLFFGTDFHSISHIAIAIDETYMVEAGGGGKFTNNKGSVRIKRIKNRSDLLCAMKIEKE